MRFVHTRTACCEAVVERDEAYLCSETERLWSRSINDCGADECLTHYSLWTICETAKCADWLPHS